MRSIRAARSRFRVHAIITIDELLAVAPSPFTVGVSRSADLAHRKVGTWGAGRGRAGVRPEHCRGSRGPDSGRVRPIDPVFDEWRRASDAPIIHDVLKPAGMFTDLKHPRGDRYQRGARRAVCAGATSPEDSPKPISIRGQFTTSRSPRDVRADGVARRAARRRPDHPHGIAESLVRPRRGQPPARVGRKSRARPYGAPRRRIRREAVHQARSAGGRLRAARAQARSHRPFDGRTVLHDHEARRDGAHQTVATNDGRIAREVETHWNGGA